jgi:hypothetical protein
VFFFAGWEDEECSCPDCVGEEHPENRESASEVLKRKYANGEITGQELDEKLRNITTIEENEERINRELERRFN